MSDDPIGILRDPFVGTAHDSAREDDELELLEFLAADVDPVPADPEFRRNLSDLLWEMVRDGRVARPRNH